MIRYTYSLDLVDGTTRHYTTLHQFGIQIRLDIVLTVDCT